MPPKKQKMEIHDDDDGMDMDMDQMLSGMGGMDMPMAKYMNPNYSEEFMASLPEKIRQRAQVLLKYHDDFLALQEEMKKKETALKLQFEKDTAHLSARRREIVTGTGEPVSEEEVKKGFPAEHEGKVTVEADATDSTKGLPSFWVRALSNHVGISSMIEEHDVDVLEHLIDVSCRTLEDGLYGSQAVDFHFAANDFFDNEVLTLSMIGTDKGAEVKRTTINWKPGKDVTVETIQKKQKARGSGKVRTVSREVPRESFFNLFKEKDGEDEEDDEEAEEEDEDENVISLLQVLFNNIVPNAVRHYTGEAPDGSSDMEEDEEDEEEEDEEEDDDDEMEAMMAMRGRGGRGGARGGRGGRGGRGF